MMRPAEIIQQEVDPNGLYIKYYVHYIDGAALHACDMYLEFFRCLSLKIAFRRTISRVQH